MLEYKIKLLMYKVYLFETKHTCSTTTSGIEALQCLKNKIYSLEIKITNEVNTKV